MTIKLKATNVMNIMNGLLQERIMRESDTTVQLIRRLSNKMTKQFKKDFLAEASFDIFVTDIQKAEIELQPYHIKQIANFWYAYFIFEVIRLDVDFHSMDISVHLHEYTKAKYEALEFIRSLMVVLPYTENSTTVNLDKIETILTMSNKKNYAKGAKKSVLHTLTGIRKSRTFRVHPEAKNRIVGINELGQYLKLKDRHKRLNCPICGEAYDIDIGNIDRILKFRGHEFIFGCQHEKSHDSEMMKKGNYRIDLSVYFSSAKNASKRDKQMFVLNNFERIVHEKS